MHWFIDPHPPSKTVLMAIIHKATPLYLLTKVLPVLPKVMEEYIFPQKTTIYGLINSFLETFKKKTLIVYMKRMLFRSKTMFFIILAYLAFITMKITCIFFILENQPGFTTS